MRRFPEPQHFFAAEWQNWDFAIAIIFYPEIRTLWKFLCILFGCCSTQILNFNAKKNFAKFFKIVRKLGKTLIFGQFLKSQFCHSAAKKCCGSGNLLIWKSEWLWMQLLTYYHYLPPMWMLYLLSLCILTEVSTLLISYSSFLWTSSLI